MKTNSIRFIKSVAGLVLMIHFASCTNQHDPESVAKAYCNCMEENGSPQNYKQAYKICDKQFIKENKIYKLYKVDLRDYALQAKIPYETKDSVYKYMKKFNDYTMSNCCSVVLECEMDSIMRDLKKPK